MNQKMFTGLKVAMLMLVVCFSLAVFSAFCPVEPIRMNVESSFSELKKEGLYPCFLNFKLFQMDNYTDTIMLQESVTIDTEAPIQSAMTCTIYKSDAYMDKIEDLGRYLSGDLDGMQAMDYSRYWHGYLFILKPLLMVLTYQQIRMLNYVVFSAVLLFVLSQLWRKLGKLEAILFLCAMLSVSAPLIPYNLQFSWTFYIAFGGILWMIHIPEEAKQTEDIWMMALSVFVLGGITSFLDLLVTPIVTIGLPLTVWLMKKKGWTSFDKLKAVVIAAIVWVIGYAWIWGSKWVIGSFITGKNIIGDVILQAEIRTTGLGWRGMELTIFNIVKFIGKTLAQRGLLIPLLIVIVVGITSYLLLCKSWKAVWENLWLLLIAMMTPVWFVVLREHSIQHGWFTWRALVVTVFAGLLFIVRTCDYKQLKERLRSCK